MPADCPLIASLLVRYLSADASRAAAAKYTGDDQMLLLVEAVLGRVWHLRSGEAMHGLDAAKVRSASDCH